MLPYHVQALGGEPHHVVSPSYVSCQDQPFITDSWVTKIIYTNFHLEPTIPTRRYLQWTFQHNILIKAITSTPLILIVCLIANYDAMAINKSNRHNCTSKRMIANGVDASVGVRAWWTNVDMRKTINSSANLHLQYGANNMLESRNCQVLVKEACVIMSRRPLSAMSCVHHTVWR
jgi:hypothetical protein